MEKALLVFGNIALQQFEIGRTSTTQKKKLIEKMKVPLVFSALIHGKYLYVFMMDKIGKEEGNEVWCLEFTNPDAEWTKMRNMIGNHGLRPSVVVAKTFSKPLEKRLVTYFYAIGDGDCDCVERFNPETADEGWTRLPTTTPRKTDDDALLVMQDCIYGFGVMLEEGRYISDVWKFNPANYEWTGMSPMPEAIKSAAAAELNGKAYVMGGLPGHDRHQTSQLESAWQFDPGRNEWTLLKPMTDRRSKFRSFAIDGFIYAVGGNMYGRKDSIEKYDVENNEWTMVPMPEGITKFREVVKI